MPNGHVVEVSEYRADFEKVHQKFTQNDLDSLEVKSTCYIMYNFLRDPHLILTIFCRCSLGLAVPAYFPLTIMLNFSLLFNF